MGGELLLRELREGVVTLTLNRPEQFNALCQEMLAALQDALDEVGGDPGVRAVVLGGAGPNFCAGHDLKQMRARPEKGYYRQLFDQCVRVTMTMAALPQPVIAKIQGVATAAGCQLVAMCDLAVATKAARFATSGIGVGLFCSTPAVPLSRNLPRKRAFEMLVTGEFIDAETALALGLVNRVVPAAGLEAAAAELARKIAEKSPEAIRSGKRMFYPQLEMPMAEAYAYAAEVMACDMMGEDAAEGIDAFIERRKPVWRGR